MSRVIGDDGNISIGSGHGGAIRAWTLNLPRPVINVTAHGDVQQKSRVGPIDITGSATGVPVETTDPGPFARAEVSIVCTSATGNAITVPAYVSNITIGSDKTDAALLSFDFVKSAGIDATHVWT